MNEDLLKDLAASNRALLLLALRRDQDPDKAEKLELLLIRAGYSAKDAAMLLGKNAAAVRKASQRAKKAA